MGCVHKKRSAKECFEKKFRVTPGCWIWTGALGRRNYGIFGMNNTTMGAHRASHILYVGPIPSGMLVCHRCDNPRCVNPDHLFLGTYLDNNRDMHAKGRANPPRGSKNWKARLTEEQAARIYRDPRRQSEIAADYGISANSVSAIKTRSVYRHALISEGSPAMWSVCGEKNPHAKLGAESVILILRDSRPYSAIAADFGISKGYVSVLKSGKAWRHVFESAAHQVGDTQAQ